MKVVGMKILEVMGTLQFRSSVSEIFLLSHKMTTNLTCLNTGQRYGMLYEQLQKLTFIWLKQLWIVLASLSSLKTYPLAMMKEVKFLKNLSFPLSLPPKSILVSVSCLVNDVLTQFYLHPCFQGPRA
jgi:hypothetical protein